MSEWSHWCWSSLVVMKACSPRSRTLTAPCHHRLVYYQHSTRPRMIWMTKVGIFCNKNVLPYIDKKVVTVYGKRVWFALQRKASRVKEAVRERVDRRLKVDSVMCPANWQSTWTQPATMIKEAPQASTPTCLLLLMGDLSGMANTFYHLAVI